MSAVRTYLLSNQLMRAVLPCTLWKSAEGTWDSCGRCKPVGIIVQRASDSASLALREVDTQHCTNKHANGMIYLQEV